MHVTEVPTAVQPLQCAPQPANHTSRVFIRNHRRTWTEDNEAYVALCDEQQLRDIVGCNAITLSFLAYRPCRARLTLSASDVTKAVTRGGGVLGIKTPPKLFAIFLLSQLCLIVQQNIFRLRLLNIGVCLNYLQCQFMLD